ncbi:penicillin acylase family protein [Oceanicoccus sp. KOV_DT_Chl]|uniref:penicillin acylase family protein n=1 Tax=Oceanicoccus sp. KOV_DT_Chl TaxID=1904639 RepID=UPI000C7B8DF6|nr:penicillin acylase family protein [Oceanicoccus sp. KOV_DT_Chl]
MKTITLLIICLFLLPACHNNSNSKNDRYEAEIVWTEYGIPHITAKDWGGLGYGYGYAFSQENYCVLMQEIVRANGNSARYLEDGDLDKDYVWKFINNDERINAVLIASFSDQLNQLLNGYVAGVNRYFKETGVDNLAEGEEGCRGASYARTINQADVVKFLHKLMLRASTDPLADYIVAATPPASVVTTDAAKATTLLAQIDPKTLATKLGMPSPEQLGSNAYAIGADASATGAGILFGNPHFPWQGSNRFYMSHMTIPGEYDVSGGSLFGVPAILIGFNRDLAWSHTVSTGQRFTFYELTLNPGNPLQYDYDGEWLDLEAVTVSADSLSSTGDVVSSEHTFYLSRFGPVLDLGGVSSVLAGWPNFAGTVMAYRDANLENFRGFDQWIGMGQATNLEEFTNELKAIGIPWVNTIAADRYGDALYADISAVPHVTQQKLNSCVTGTIAQLLTQGGFTTLDGSTSDCEWGNDAGAPEGVFGFDSLPQIANPGVRRQR